MTAVGDGRLDEDPAVSVGAVGVGGGDMESGALLQTVRNKPKTRGGQRIRTRSPCREKRVHASELPTTNSYPAGHASFSNSGGVVQSLSLRVMPDLMPIRGAGARE